MSLPQKLSFRVKVGSEADVTITFDPAQSSFGYTHLAYKVPFTIHSNPVYNRLKSKAGQLGKAGFEGIKGIILCDAGCQMLTRQGHWGLDLGGAEIISAFLKQEDSVGFVIVLSVESDGTHRLGPDHLRIVGKTYVNPRQRGNSPLFDDLSVNLLASSRGLNLRRLMVQILKTRGVFFWRWQRERKQNKNVCEDCRRRACRTNHA